VIILKLAYFSLINRRLTTALTVLSVAISVLLLLGVEKVRIGARESFSNTISQTDLIVGARTGPIQLLLYAVFHMGEATNNISYDSYLKFKAHENVDWTIPYSLGDSHRGYRVVATDVNFYTHYRFRYDRSVEFLLGIAAKGIFDVVLGYEVAKRLEYKVGQKITLSHGVYEGGGVDHADKPFTVVGILKQTSTPIDRSLYITLEGMEAIHIDWQSGAPPMAGMETPVDQIARKIKIKQITAFLLRTKSRIQALYLERDINTYPDEPLLAIIPRVALSQLWQGISYAEDGLRFVSFFVLVSGFIGMLTALYTSISERRREMAILRALGASPLKVLTLLVLESTLLTILGIFLGTSLLYLGLFALRPFIEHQFGLYLAINPLTINEWLYITVTLVAGFLIGLIPAWKAYKNALADGLTVRV
jgi:putative ABC transport system permease protein